MSVMYEDIIQDLNRFDGADILEPLVMRHFEGKVACVSSFGAESAVLLHMVAMINRSLPVITLDTGKLFWETTAYRKELIATLGLTDVRIIAPGSNALRRLDPNGTLYRLDPDRCCHLRKIEPLARALHGFTAWIAGRKRYHGGTRAGIPMLEERDGRLKVEPLARFTARDIDAYLDRHGLPRHPLVQLGYRSIGCAPCTVACGMVADPRAGRWPGQAKRECGIHQSLNGAPEHRALTAVS
jgi:phosphoadenosine phosphosulfate reductase